MPLTSTPVVFAVPSGIGVNRDSIFIKVVWLHLLTLVVPTCHYVRDERQIFNQTVTKPRCSGEFEAQLELSLSIH